MERPDYSNGVLVIVLSLAAFLLLLRQVMWADVTHGAEPAAAELAAPAGVDRADPERFIKVKQVGRLVHHRLGGRRHDDLRFAGGEYVCALDRYADRDSVHVLRPNAKAGSWKGTGYVAKRVTDANGPFDGVWYADEYAIRIERQIHVNKWLLPDARKGPVRSTPPIYKSNAEMAEAAGAAGKTAGHTHPDSYLAAIPKHELLHSELM